MKKFFKLFFISALLLISKTSFGAVTGVTIVVEEISCPGVCDGKAYYTGFTTTPGSTGPYIFSWVVPPNPTQIGDTARNLCAGIHVLQVFDASDNTVFNINFTVALKPALFVNKFVGDVSCFGVCDGTAFAAPGGGTPIPPLNSYLYQWDDPGLSTTQSLNGLCAGSYNVTVTDDNGCTTTDVFVIGGPTQIVPNVTAVDVDCNGNNNGSATAAPTGGAGTYTYSWSSTPGNNTPTETGLGPATYMVTITDVSGCTGVGTFMISEPMAMGVTVTPSDVACFGDMTGSASASVTGGSVPYTFTWPASGTPAGGMVSDLIAGSYNVTVDDANGCQVIEPFTIGTRPEIIIDLDSTDVDCNSNSTGSVTAMMSGGTPGYNWTWSSGVAGTGVAAASTNLAAGTYTITVTDAFTCVKVDSIVVNEPGPLVASIASITNPLCVGSVDGTINLMVSGGTMPYTYMWNDGDVNEDRTGLVDGFYSVVVTDANNCQANADTTLVDPAPILGNLLITDALCNGSSDGVATAVPTGGSGTYVNYTWSSMNGTDSIETGLAMGNYTVTITDSDGCTAVENFTIGEPTVVTASVVPNDVACFGESNGSAIATAGGGTPIYTYAWGDPGLTVTMDPINSVSGLVAGTYMLTVTDNNGCPITVPYTIGTRPEIITDLDSTDVDCNGNMTGAISANISGGTPNYNWTWSNGTVGTGAVASISNLVAGTYRITVTDVFACSKVDSIVVNEPPALVVVIDNQMDPLCSGDLNGTINITASGGTPTYTYAWSDINASEDRTGLGGGVYTVTVTDGNNCTTMITTTLTDPVALTASIDSLEDASCNGLTDGYARVLAVGGTGAYTYAWPAAVTTRDNPNIGVGTYIVTVTDANNCQTTATAVIGEPVALATTATSMDASCSGLADGSATVMHTGGTAPHSYQWSANAASQTTQTATSLTSGTYFVTVTDANGCTDSTNAIVGQPSTIVLSTSKNDADCNGASTGDATVSVVGGTNPLTFLWSVNAASQTTATATGLAAGMYTVTVTDNNGCNDNVTVTIGEPTAVLASITGSTDPTCTGINNGTATAAGSGGTEAGAYNFIWSVNAASQTTPTATGLAAGTYSVTVTDDNGCTDSASVTLTAPISVVVMETTMNVSCFGGNDGEIRTTVTGGTMPYTYSWNGTPGSQDTLMITAGTYNLTVTDNNGCFVLETYIITQPTSDLSATFDTTDVSCNGLSDGTAKVTVIGGTTPYTYAWQGSPMANAANDSIFNLVAATYRLTVTDGNGCTMVDSTVINEPNAILVNLVTKTDVNCNGDLTGDATVLATGGDGNFTYLWSPSATVGPTITNVAAGTYTVTATDGNMCTEELVVNITEPDTLRPTLFTYDVGCGAPANGAAAIRASGGTATYTYNWTPTIVDGAGTDSVFNLAPGNYSVTVTDNNGCDSIQAFTINSVSSNFVFTDSVRNDSCNGSCNGFLAIMNLAGGTSPYTFNWSRANETTSSISNVCAGNYSVTITDFTGCDSIVNYTITEPAAMIASFDTTDVTCNGLSDGNAKITVIGGTAPYTYTWQGSPMGNATNDSIFNLAAATYRVTVTDGNGCTIADSTLINQPNAIAVNLVSKTDVNCNGDLTGDATVLATGGDGNFNYLWDPSATVGPTITNVAAGTYTVTATDGNMCTEELVVNITEPDTLRPILFTYDVGCGAPSNGAAAIRASGGTATYTYNWTPTIVDGAGTDSVFNLAPGNYSVTVTDNNGCDSIQAFTISSANSNFVFTDSVRNDSCNGSCNGFLAIMNLAGGTSPYTFNWSRANETTSSISNVCAGNYSVTITDFTGCDSIVNYTITEPAAMIASFDTTDVTCNGLSDGSAKITIAGGTAPYTYIWQGSPMGNAANDSIFNLAAATYLVTVTDANGCTIADSTLINQPNAIIINLVSKTDVVCNGDLTGNATVLAAGGDGNFTYLWNPTATVGPVIGNLGAGTYTVTATDGNMCTEELAVTINEADSLKPTLTKYDVSCGGTSDGRAAVSVTGGTGAYTYNWGPGITVAQGQATDSIFDVLPGTYFVTVTDNSGCDSIQTFDISSSNSSFTFTDSVRNDSCGGACNGFLAILNLSGGVSPYTYNWSRANETTSSISNVCAGPYSVTITDASGCDSVLNYMVTEPPAITVTVNTIPDTCVAGVGSANATNVMGGTAPYTYDWGSGPTSSTSVNSLIAGSYDLTVSDANGCQITEPYSIGNEAPFTIAFNITDVTCAGFTNGAIQVSTVGASNPVTYNWSDNSLAGANPTSISAGTYGITVTDVNGCAAIDTAIVAQPLGLVIQSILVIDETCNPGNDGMATATVSGGVTPYTYDWGAGQTTNNSISNLVTGNYSLTLTDANNCRAIENFVIGNVAPFTVTGMSTMASCNGGMDGTIDLTLSGATPPVTFAWDNGLPAIANQTGLAAGTYLVTVTDGTACSEVLSFPIIEETPINVVFDTIQDESCTPGMDGFAKITASDGLAPYTYDWTPVITGGAGTDSVFNLLEGSYNVTVTDANGCTSINPFAVMSASDIVTTQTNVRPSCFGDMNGSISLSATGGVAPYTFEWISVSPVVTGTSLSNIGVGNYSVRITDSSVPPCEKVEVFALDGPAPISVLINTTLESCTPANDGSATATVSGGTSPFTFDWGAGQTASNTIATLTAGSHNVTITDANNCIRIEPFTIIAAQNFTATLTQKDPKCNGGMDGELLVTNAGGINPLSYNWTGGLSGADPKNVSAGTYTITITDVFGCTAEATATLGEPSAITATFVITDETCMPGNDGAAVATASNGQGPNYTYNWPGGVTGNTITGLTSGTYNLTVSDDSSCMSIIPFTIGSTAPFTLTSSIMNIDCAGNTNGAIDLTVTGAIGTETYLWSANVPGNVTDQDQNNLVAGTYDVTITDPGNGCSETESYTITEPDSLKGTASVINAGCQPVANDGAINLTVTGGTTPYTYLWSNNAMTEDISGLLMGSYTVTITDDRSCQITETFVVGNMSQVVIDMDSVDVSCNGAMDGRARVTVTGGLRPYTYLWSNNGNNTGIGTLSGGTYSVTVTDNAACSAVDSVVVNEEDAFLTTFTITDENCVPGGDGAASAATTGGVPPYTYQWSAGTGVGNTVSGLTANTYTVVVSDLAGCSVVESFVIGNAAPFTAVTMTTDPICAGDATGTINITVTGETGILLYDWPTPLPSQANQTGLIAGTYTVTITDVGNGCTEAIPIDILEPDSIKATANITNETCNPGMNGAIDITATGGDSGPYTYNWSGTSITTPTLEDQSSLSAGTYYVTITDGNNCFGVDSFTVISISSTIPNLVTINDGCSPFAICLGTAKVSPTGGVAPYSFAWANAGTPIIVPANTDSIGMLCAGNYTVTITDASGCDTIVPFNLLGGRTVLPNEVVTDESCNVDDDGTITVTPTGGQAPYTYAWAGSANTDSMRTGLTPGTYTVTITDVSSCDTTITLMVGTEQFDYTVDSTDLSCSGICDGTVSVTLPGANIPDFTFLWSTSATTQNLGSLCAGTYYVTITNTVNGCVKEDSTIVNPTTPILPNETFTDESCFALCDGTIDLNPMGGAGNYTYAWTPSSLSGANITGLCGGTYTVTISDASGCDTSLSFTIQSAPQILANIVTQDLSCGNSGSCDGKAYVTPTNGATPYNFNWGTGVVTGVTPDTAINLCAGNYTVTITDNDGCSIIEPYTISGPSAISASFAVTSSTCNLCNGIIDVTATGGSGGYTYEWFDATPSPIGTGANIGSLCAGAYSVVITDNTGCSESFNTNVNDIGAEVITTSFTDVSCFGGNDGTATVSFTCNDPRCMIEWFNTTTGASLGIITNTATGLSAGDYHVEVTNFSGCKATENVTLSQPTEFQVFATITNNVCGGGALGAINLNTSGGTGTYTYSWSPAPASGQNTNSVSGLTAGTWSVTVSDASSCDTILSYVIAEPLSITASFTSSAANCNMADGVINATISGGTIATDYQYQWFDGANNLLMGETNPVIMNIAAGSYALRVRDDNVCEKRFNILLNNSNGPTIVVDSTKSAGCFGESNGAIYTTASGANSPFTYNWLPTGETSEDIINLAEGIYTVKVTDALGCIASAIDSVKTAAELMATVSVVEATCGLCNGTASIVVSGGTAPYSYLWSNGSTLNTTDGLCGGNYSVVVTDSLGCNKSFDFGVNTIGGPTGETITATAASCSNTNDGTATVTPIGGTPPYTYLWQHNGSTSNTLNNLGKGIYFLHVSDLKGCSRTVQVDIDSPSEIIVAEQIVGVTCNSTPCDGSILLSVSGGMGPYTYDWGIPNSDTNYRDILCAGVYNVSITDANGCMENRTITVSNTGSPITAVPTITDASCYGTCNGSLVSNLIDSTDVDFRWLDNQGNFIAGPNTDIKSTVCAGTYVLETTTILLGCKSYMSVLVGQPDSITLSGSIVKNVSCNGSCDGEIFINTRGGNILYNYSWNDPSQQDEVPAIGLCAGTYGVTATDANGCTATTSVILDDPPLLTTTITSNTNLICSSDCNASATSVGSGGTPPYAYNWSGGQTGPNPNNLCFGMNTLTITDARNCQVSDVVFISAIDTVVTESFGNTVICDEDSIHLNGKITGNSITTFGWFLEDTVTLFTTTLDTTFLAPIGKHNYFLIATSGSCSDTAEFNAEVFANPVVGLEPSLRLFNDEVSIIEITNEDISYIFTWTPDTALNDNTLAEPLTSIKEDITYTLTVVDTNGCIFVDSIAVTYSPNIDIPSGFTPNGDGTNDVWNIQYLNEFPSARVQVYNRWGQLLFNAGNGYVTPWDGTYNGSALPIGTYYYVIDLKDAKVKKPITGPVTIVR